MVRFALLALFPFALAMGEGTEPRSKAADYPAHAVLETLEIGADYLVHSVSGHNRFPGDPRPRQTRLPRVCAAGTRGPAGNAALKLI